MAGPLPATALNRALRVPGDPWTMLILKEACNGARRFGLFRTRLGIPRQTLSLRLAHPAREQMLWRRPVGPNHAAAEYVPTPKTRDIQDAMDTVRLWPEANREEIDVMPFDIVHVPCGARLRAHFACTACGGAAGRERVRIFRTDPPQVEAEPRGRLSRRTEAAVLAGVGGGNQTLAASIVGDPPANAILWLLFRGAGRLAGLSQAPGIGPAAPSGVFRCDRCGGRVTRETVRTAPRAA